MTTSPPLRCGRCGAALDPSQADLADDGYRCLGCSTDERLAANAALDRRERDRGRALTRLRVAVFACAGLVVAMWMAEVYTRAFAALLLVPAGYLLLRSVRDVLR